MYDLSRRIRKTVLRTYMRLYIYDDAKMRENDVTARLVDFLSGI